MKAKWTILAAMGFLVLLLSLPFVPEYLLAGSHQKAVEASFKKFAESDKDGIYSAFDSMLINRVAADPSVAKRVKMSNISDCDFLGSDFSALEHLPNLEELVIYSSKNCDAVVPVINRLPRLTRITFADCGLSDAGFDKLNHRGLMSFRMSAYAKNWTDDAITRLKARIATCSFDIDAQE